MLNVTTLKWELCLIEALQIRQSQLGDNPMDVANSLVNLAVLYTSAGRWEKVEECNGQAYSRAGRVR